MSGKRPDAIALADEIEAIHCDSSFGISHCAPCGVPLDDCRYRCAARELRRLAAECKERAEWQDRAAAPKPAPLPTFADMRGILKNPTAEPTPSFDIWEGRGELPGLKPKPTPQHEHTDSCFGPNYSHCPAPVACSGCDCPKDRCDSYGPGKKCCPDCNHSEAPSATEFAGPPGFRRERAPATRDEERERLLAELGPWRDRGRVGRAAAMLESDGKRIAELEAEADKQQKRAERAEARLRDNNDGSNAQDLGHPKDESQSVDWLNGWEFGNALDQCEALRAENAALKAERDRAAAMLEADAKRIAELEQENADLLFWH